MASKIVAVAGGTGNLGRAITEELIAHGGYNVFILGREVNAEKAKEIGAETLAIDYNNVDSIVEVLESKHIDTVISTLSSQAGEGPELALIQAAEKSKGTKRYIPSVWGVKYTAEQVERFPLGKAKSLFMKTLEATSLEYTQVLNGFFLDYFGFPKVKSYQGNLPLVVDIANNFAAIPGSGNVPVTLTYTFDIGRFTAALLTQPKWEKDTVIIGDKITWNEFVAIAEKVKGVKFDVKKDDVAALEQGQITELPGHPALYTYMPKEFLQALLASFGLMFDCGLFDLKKEGSLNERFPEIKTKSVKDIIEEAYGGN